MHRRLRVSRLHDEIHLLELLQADAVLYLFDVPESSEVPFAYAQTASHQLPCTRDESGAVGMENNLLANEIDFHLFGRGCADDLCCLT